MPATRITSMKRADEGVPDLSISFTASPDDPEYRDPAYQAELYAIEKALKGDGLRVQSAANFQKSGTGGTWLTGDFVIYLKNVGPYIPPIIVAWITARTGRKVRIKVGDTEIEAANVEQIKTLLETVEKLKSPK